ncbi:MAG: endonuclease domain-containing protein [Anaerolineae bacterium]
MRTGEYIRVTARHLRHRSTVAESLLWTELRSRRLCGLKFRRQHPIGPYIADFCCVTARLVIEIDGPVHRRQSQRDAARTDELHRRGFRVIRFTNEQVLNDIEGVLQGIARACGVIDGEADETAW